MPDYYAPNLRQFWVWNNKITGTTPPVLFTKPNAIEHKCNKNKTIGRIIVHEHCERSLLQSKCLLLCVFSHKLNILKHACFIFVNIFRWVL